MSLKLEFSRRNDFDAPLYHLVGYAAAATGGGGGRGLIFMLPPLPPREDTETGIIAVMSK